MGHYCFPFSLSLTPCGSEEEPPRIVKKQDAPDENGRQFHDGDFVPGGGHAAEAAGGPGERVTHGGEGIGLSGHDDC